MFWTTLSIRIMHMIAARHICSNSYTGALTSESPWQRKKFFYHTGTLISGLWARFNEDGSTAPVRQVTKCLSLIQEEFLTKPKFTLKTLQSIIGTLNFACVVVLPGQASLRRLIDLTMGVSKPHYFIRITKEAREDLHMWAEFLANFNGRTIFMAEQSVCTQVFHQWAVPSSGVKPRLVHCILGQPVI